MTKPCHALCGFPYCGSRFRFPVRIPVDRLSGWLFRVADRITAAPAAASATGYGLSGPPFPDHPENNASDNGQQCQADENGGDHIMLPEYSRLLRKGASFPGMIGKAGTAQPEAVRWQPLSRNRRPRSRSSYRTDTCIKPYTRQSRSGKKWQRRSISRCSFRGGWHRWRQNTARKEG